MKFIKKEPRIYIISGKASSGKDTTANIIAHKYKDKKCVILTYAKYIKDYAKKIKNWDGSDETKPRTFLQQIGTELIRQNISDKFFVRRMLEDIEVYSYFFDVIIIADARTKEEIEVIKKNYPQAKAIRIERKEHSIHLNEEEKKHITELELDQYSKFDYVIENNGTKEELETVIGGIL